MVGTAVGCAKVGDGRGVWVGIRVDVANNNGVSVDVACEVGAACDEQAVSTNKRVKKNLRMS